MNECHTNDCLPIQLNAGHINGMTSDISLLITPLSATTAIGYISSRIHSMYLMLFGILDFS